jgi:hypothetical protein
METSANLETVAVFKEDWDKINNKEFETAMELAKIKGKIQALSEIDDSPEFVMKQLKEIASNFK